MGNVSVVNAAHKAYVAVLNLHAEAVDWCVNTKTETLQATKLINQTRELALNISEQFSHVHKSIHSPPDTLKCLGEHW